MLPQPSCPQRGHLGCWSRRRPRDLLLYSGPHAGGTPDTDELRTRATFVLDPSTASVFLSTEPDGRYTLQGFYQHFLQPDLDSGDAACIAVAAPLTTWWRIACTCNGANSTTSALDPIAAGLPHELGRFNRWASHQKATALARLGVGGPSLSSAAFNAGVHNLATVMNDNARDRIEYDRAKSALSFTEKHGATMAETLSPLRLHR